MAQLDRYQGKRDFNLTPEPAGDDQEGLKSDSLSFVVQKHDASHLHFDFRLEVDGVLRSWAVPKGLPTKKGQRRLAVMTEDHPLAYASFEGNIPKGQYGGGTVMIWDRGTFLPEGAASREDAEKLALSGIESGKLIFHLDGQKLKGSFHLIRSDTRDWLLISRSDVEAKGENSVISGRSMDEIRSSKPPLTDKKFPSFLGPMVPEEFPKPFDDENWTFELKVDGIRALAIRNGQKLVLLSRQGKDITDRFPQLVSDLLAVPDPSFVLDGEIVSLDSDGRPSFHQLMEGFGLKGLATSRSKAQFWIFDMPFSQGRDLRKIALRERRQALVALNLSGKSLRLLDSFPTTGKLLFDQAVAMGFEGIVAKRLDSPYRDSERSGDWRKVKKYHTEEFLVAGYTRGMGAREHTFGALILARRDEHGLKFCGSVGGGFSDVLLESIKKKLDQQLEIPSPFDQPIETKGEPRFVSPDLIVEVRFMAWTPEGRLRMPQFVRLRPDLTVIESNAQTDDVESILAALDQGKNNAQVTIEGHEMELTNLDRELWPARGDDPALTKRDLIAYYARVSRVMLPHLRNRPLAIVRHPQGVKGAGFFQKHADEAPNFVDRVSIWSDHNKGAREWMMCNNLSSLVWLGQVAALEIHPWYSRIDNEPDATEKKTEFGSETDLDESILSFPDFVVFDLDPAFPKLSQVECWQRSVKVGVALRKVLSDLGMRSYPKSSGKSGLHVYVPLRREHDYAELRALAEGIGQHLMKDRSLEVTMEWNLSKRPAGVFFDHKQNVRGKTLAAPYSPRPVAGAPVSMPLRWDELETVSPWDFNLLNAPSLIADRGDAWKDLLTDCQTLWFNPK